MALIINLDIPDLEMGTNIIDIDVPEHLRRKVECGIEWVDDSMGGKGFTPSTVGMLTGTSGGGKTTLFLMLADSITKNGNVCLYNTAEESVYQVAMTAERLGIKRHGFFIGYDYGVIDALVHADFIYDKYVKGQQDANGQQKTLFVLIDSLQAMDDGKYKDGGRTGNTPLRVAKALADYAKQRKNVVVLFIGQVTKGGEFAGKYTIKHAVDMHLHLYIDMRPTSEAFGERVFTVQKNRFGSAGKTFILGMNENGLWKKGEFVPITDK